MIITPTPNISSSIEFYKKLQFHVQSSATRHYAQDGNLKIQIDESRYARPGIKLYRETWEDSVETLKSITPVITTEEGFLLSDPSGVWIYLVEGTLDMNSIADPKAKSLLGNFAGLSLETIDIQHSMNLWSNLGFKHTMGSAEGGWISLENEDKMGLSIMRPNACPHMFYNPSLTYFNSGKNLEVIAAIRQAGIAIMEEITHFNKEGIVDNVIIRDPGGYGYFIFND